MEEVSGSNSKESRRSGLMLLLPPVLMLLLTGAVFLILYFLPHMIMGLKIERTGIQRENTTSPLDNMKIVTVTRLASAKVRRAVESSRSCLVDLLSYGADDQSTACTAPTSARTAPSAVHAASNTHPAPLTHTASPLPPVRNAWIRINNEIYFTTISTGREDNSSNNNSSNGNNNDNKNQTMHNSNKRCNDNNDKNYSSNSNSNNNNKHNRSVRGVVTMRLDMRTCTSTDLHVFDTYSDELFALDFAQYAKSLGEGSILLGVTADEPYSKLSPAYDVFQTGLGVNLTGLNWRGKFGFIAQMGRPEKTLYDVRPAGGKGLRIIVSITQGSSQYDVNFEICEFHSAKRLIKAKKDHDQIHVINDFS